MADVILCPFQLYFSHMCYATNFMELMFRRLGILASTDCVMKHSTMCFGGY